MMPRRREGFTLIEMLVVLIFLGLLAGIALLKYIDLRNTARVAAVVGDVRAVTVGSFNYFGDNDAWPADASAGAVPIGLGPYLPGELAQTFDRSIYTLDFDNVSTGSGTEPLTGVSITTSDPQLMAKFVSNLSSKYPYYVAGGKLTYLIAGF
jgi:prepilin-type N-terminal cleavage/methylation domain-containing protein